MFIFLYGLFLRYYSSSPTRSTLEVLPDELLLEILSYLSITDLFHGWLNLNWRFHVIVHDLPITKVYNEPEPDPKRSWWQQWWYSWRNPNDAELLRYFAFQVVSLQTHEYLSPSVVNNIDILDYPNLRMLTFREATPTQLDVIREHNFRHLKYLSLVKTKDFSFEILCQFKSLRSCELSSLKIDDKYSCSSSSIRSLILRECDPSSLFHLLPHLPQITSLIVTIFWTSAFVDQFDSTSTFVHPHLKSLHISMFNLECSMNEMNTDRCDFVSALLTHVSPHIRNRCHLTLCGMSNFNFEQLQDTVFKRNFFRFSCLLMYVVKYHSVPNFNHIRQLPLYNQLKPLDTSNDAFIVYGSKWTNASHTSLK